MDMGNYTDVMYMDFQKAFDTVLYKRLISKLNSFNIRKELIRQLNDKR